MAKHPSIAPALSRADALTRSTLEGLRRSPKELSPVWFYDELGSSLFDRICELPEYYITRTELQIMHAHAAEMARHIGAHAALIELGSGTSTKTRLLLDQLETPYSYVPVDISREHLLEAADSIARDYPALSVIPVYADFTQSFDLPPKISTAERRVLYFPGSTLGNFTETEALKLLSRMRAMIGAGGAALIGIDLKKDPRLLERAYDDAAGVTAKFNLNALRHINRELGADFDLGGFKHRAVWVEQASRIEMHLVSQRDQSVHLGGEVVRIARGEHLCTEHCHKYTLDGFGEMAHAAGLRVRQVWLDPQALFSVQLLEAR